jgi:CAAX prenyl protease-like protein
MFPYLAYLLLLATQDFFPPRYWSVFIAVHIAVSLWVCRLFRHHYPSWGRPHFIIAVLAGLFAAWGWVSGQHVLDGVTLAGLPLGGRLPFYPGSSKVFDPHDAFHSGPELGVYLGLKIARAATAVPIVEELLWRGFLLRAFVSWDRYDQVPWGGFYWRAFIGTALLSSVQHPDNWAVSIICWLFYNLLFYWKKSLLCLMITHSVTNVALYSYVVWTGDWRFW